MVRIKYNNSIYSMKKIDGKWKCWFRLAQNGKITFSAKKRRLKRTKKFYGPRTSCEN